MPQWHREKQKTKRLAASTMERNLEELLGDLPAPDEVVRVVTFRDFTAVGLLRYIVERTHVRWMGIVTLRVGKECVDYIRSAADRGRIDEAAFILGYLSAQRHGHERDEADRLDILCEEHGWTMLSARNHAKVFLFDTDAGFYVVETSCNLNALPNWEQFMIEQDSELFSWYKDIFFDRRRGTAEEWTRTTDAPDQISMEGDPWEDQGSPSSLSKPKGQSTSRKKKLSSARPPK